MRQIILTLLMFVMLMPSLACAMPACVESAGKTTQEAQAPCVEHHAAAAPDAQEDKKVKFLLDCMGVDLQKEDASRIDKPALKADKVGYGVGDLVPAALLPLGLVSVIRGPPPPEWVALSQTYPPLFLTTLRIRI